MRPIALLAIAISAAACFHRTPRLPAPIPPVEGSPQVAFTQRYIDIALGGGAAADARKCYFVHYTGWLTDGKKFDSSRDTMPNGQPRPPLPFAQGARRVIAGWDLGFEGMRVGGRRRLFIPYQLGYGESGRPPIPSKAELIFDVELMAVADTLPRPEATPRGQQAAPPPQCPTWADVSGRR